MGKREDVYDNEINPLMARIIEICKRHEIPVLATFQYTEPGEEAGFCTTSIPFGHEADALRETRSAWNAKRNAPALSVTETTGPDGHRTISVRRIS